MDVTCLQVCTASHLHSRVIRLGIPSFFNRLVGGVDYSVGRSWKPGSLCQGTVRRQKVSCVDSNADMRLIFIPALQLGNLSDTSDGRISLDTARSNIATEMMEIRI